MTKNSQLNPAPSILSNHFASACIDGAELSHAISLRQSAEAQLQFTKDQCRLLFTESSARLRSALEQTAKLHAAIALALSDPSLAPDTRNILQNAL